MRKSFVVLVIVIAFLVVIGVGLFIIKQRLLWDWHFTSPQRKATVIFKDMLIQGHFDKIHEYMIIDSPEKRVEAYMWESRMKKQKVRPQCVLDTRIIGKPIKKKIKVYTVGTKLKSRKCMNAAVKVDYAARNEYGYEKNDFVIMVLETEDGIWKLGGMAWGGSPEAREMLKIDRQFKWLQGL